MTRSELLEKIRDDYVEDCSVSPEHKVLLTEFCEYAAAWFVKEGCLGVGQSSSGVSLRFNDGNDYGLFSVDLNPAAAMSVAVVGGLQSKKVTTDTVSVPAVNIIGS